MTSTNRPTTSNRKPFLRDAGRAVAALGIVAGVLAGGQAAVTAYQDGTSSEQAACQWVPHVSAVVGLTWTYECTVPANQFAGRSGHGSAPKT